MRIFFHSFFQCFHRSYRPSRLSKNEDSVWTCLYDTQTNGTSINQLYFRHNHHGTLQAISKSDDQKLRVWDLSYEQARIASGSTDGNEDRPKRPDYVDVASTEGTVGVCGPYAFASGSLGGMHNIINVVGLDADDASSPFNCSELLLPVDCAGGGGEYNTAGGGNVRTSRTGRQQRGDLKSVEHVAGLAFDAGHALLQLSDGSVVHYLHDRSGHPMLLQSPPSLCTTSVDDDTTSFGGLSPAGSATAGGLSQNKRMALARVGSQAVVLFAVSSFNENTSRGAIMLRALPGSGGADDVIASKSFRRYWGFNGLKRKRKQQQALIGSSAVVPMQPSSVANLPVGSSVGVVSVQSTPSPVAKSHKEINSVWDVTPVPASLAPCRPIDRVGKHNHQIQKRSSVESTPVLFSKRDSSEARKISPDARDLTPASLASHADKPNRTCKSHHDDDGMDSQLEVIARGSALTPKISKNNHERVPSSDDAVPMKKHKMAHDKQNVDMPKKKQKTAVQDTKQDVKAAAYLPSSPKRHDKQNDDMPKKKQKTAVQDTKQDVEAAAYLPSSPKRRGKCRVQSPTPPDSSPANDHVSMLPTEDDSNNIKAVGFLGMTTFDRREEMQLPESCFQPKQRPALLVEQLPKSTLCSRLSYAPAIQPPFPTTVATKTTVGIHFKRHCDERRQLAARHRAEHEMVRKRVLHSIRYVLSTWDVELNSNKTHAAIVESAKMWFDDALACHQEMLVSDPQGWIDFLVRCRLILPRHPRAEQWSFHLSFRI